MKSVIKAASYILVQTPDMVMDHGTTQTTEMRVNPDSEYLKKVPSHLRSFEDFCAYPPNQTYIGNMTPSQLGEIAQPWYDKKVEPKLTGRFGEIYSQEKLIAMMQVSDVFELVLLEKSFASKMREVFAADHLLNRYVDKIIEGEDLAVIEKTISEDHADVLRMGDTVVGCVKRAHDIDVNLSAHVMYENLATKASAVLAAINLCDKNDVDPSDIDYVMDCCEEACGDMNQRGGGNFAKAIAELSGFENATGCDVRGFCAGPTHALVHAASLVASGAFDNVVVYAGGCTAKLGMNGKNHVEKDMPILEDALGGFAVLISKNDGINPVVNLDILGRHTVGTGSSPQAVISSLVTNPLENVGLKITDIDKYSVEMQNPDITKPAGAGDVPVANYKMIAALGVKKGDLQRADVKTFPVEHGMVGWAPTQGHIPSGVPYVGFCRDEILAGETKRAMIIAKGSLFLGRMTNLFDGISFVIEPNDGKTEESSVSEEQIKGLIADALKGFAANLLAE